MAAELLIGQGLKILGGLFGRRRARREMRRQRALEAERRKEMDRLKKSYASIDTSNPFLNMENTLEDLTINQKQAQFEGQQFAQSQANILSGLRGAAGGSGIAALAQSMATAQAQQSQAASASIAQQESANAKLAAQGAMQVQQADIAGATAARGLEYQKAGGLMSMAQDRLGAANQARQAATASIMGGIGALGAGAGAEFGDDQP